VAIYKLIVEYNGKNFYGSQKQSSLRTVEGVLEDFINKILDTKNSRVSFFSRTDRGVHSLGNIAKLVCDKEINIKEFLQKINYFLPEDVKIVKITKILKQTKIKPKYKVYHYIVYNSSTPPVLLKDYCLWIENKIYIPILKEAIKIITSSKNLNFVATKEDVIKKKTIGCRIKIKVSKLQQFFIFKFIGTKFTQHMIRNIMSLLIQTATRKISLEQLKKIVLTWKYCKTKPLDAKALILTKIVI
jgi:tRNA pseudouridine38-40 synthase